MRGALFFALGDFRKRTRISPYRFGNCLVVNELAFAAAGDQASFAQNLQVVAKQLPGVTPRMETISPQLMHLLAEMASKI